MRDGRRVKVFLQEVSSHGGQFTTAVTSAHDFFLAGEVVEVGTRGDEGRTRSAELRDWFTEEEEGFLERRPKRFLGFPPRCIGGSDEASEEPWCVEEIVD